MKHLLRADFERLMRFIIYLVISLITGFLVSQVTFLQSQRYLCQMTKGEQTLLILLEKSFCFTSYISYQNNCRYGAFTDSQISNVVKYVIINCTIKLLSRVQRHDVNGFEIHLLRRLCRICKNNCVCGVCVR